MTEPHTELGPFSGPGAEAEPWRNTLGALRRTQKFLLGTVRADGRPHATPLLAVWALDGLCFVTGEQEQKVVNLTANPHCLLATGTNTLTGFDYVVEGIASQVETRLRDTVADAFETSYGWHLTEPDGTWSGMGERMRSGAVLSYRVQPTIVFAYGNGATFSQTRYVF